MATTGTLTPVPLPPEQISLVTQRALRNIPSPTTPCVPAHRRFFLFRAGLASDSPSQAIGGSSDFDHCSQSHQSHEAESSSCRGARLSLSSTDCPFTSSCSPPHVAMKQLLSVAGGKLHQRGAFTLRVHVASQAHERGHPARFGRGLGSGGIDESKAAEIAAVAGQVTAVAGQVAAVRGARASCPLRAWGWIGGIDESKAAETAAVRGARASCPLWAWGWIGGHR